MRGNGEIVAARRRHGFFRGLDHRSEIAECPGRAHGQRPRLGERLAGVAALDHGNPICGSGNAVSDPIEIGGAFMRLEIAPGRLSRRRLRTIDREQHILLRRAFEDLVDGAVGPETAR